MYIKRYLIEPIDHDLKEKMVFIAGPRQVGKTTLAGHIGKELYRENFEYLNWDNIEHRRAILASRFQYDKGLVIFDEIHKYRAWKTFIKGIYDTQKNTRKIIVTGSSRMDIFRKGGDSLLGRYHCYRLHPLSVAELSEKKQKIVPFKELPIYDVDDKTHNIFERLYGFGGFPEMYIKQNIRELRRWHNERSDRLIKEDIRDIEAIRDLSALQVLVEMIAGRVGNQLSVNTLAQELQVTYKTAALWTDILERFYYHFRIYPYQSTKIRALRKEPKVYLWDWSQAADEGRRLENIIASHLLKLCHFLYDWQGYKCELYYLRDRDMREVDFLVAVDNKPWFCLEVKLTEQSIGAPLRYFKEKLKIPYTFQVVKTPNIDFMQGNIRVLSAEKFLAALV